MLRRVGAAVAAATVAVGLVVAVGSAPVGAAPNAFTLLVRGPAGPCQLAGVDLASGTITPLAHVGNDACAPDIGEAPDGRVFGIQQQGTGNATTVHLLQYDTTTGAPTDLGAIGSTTPTFAPLGLSGGITFDKVGNLFVEMIGINDACADTSVCLYKVDPANPATATFLGQGPFERDTEFFAAACDGRAVTLLGEGPHDGIGSTSTTPWVPSPGPQSGQGQGAYHDLDTIPNMILAARDLSNGAVTPIGGTGNNIVAGLVFDSGGTLWGIGATPAPGFTVFTLDPATGAATARVQVNGTFDGLPFGLALPLTCPAPAVVVQPAFTG